MKKALALFFVLAAVGVTGAQAITNGHPDGTAHPNVGAFVYFSPSRQAYAITCSGSLISPTVFLTAAHCTSYLESNGIHDAYVTFDPVFTQSSTLYHGTMHTNPLYNQRQSNPGDIAVITLDPPGVTGVTPVQLPTARLLDQMKKAKTLNGTYFTSVGYGLPHVAPTLLSAERWAATGEFNSLTDSWLKISQTGATGEGGTCAGDSGGPQFLSSSNTQVSITIKGDSACMATNVGYRLDTPQARAFLDDYVTLP